MSAFGVDKASVTICSVVGLINAVVSNYTDYCKMKEFLLFLRQVLCTRYQESPMIAFGSMVSLEQKLCGMFHSLSFQTLDIL